MGVVAFELRGRTLFVQGRQAEGIAAIRRSIELDPDSIGAPLALALMLKDSGQLREAAAVAEDIVRRNPDNPRARALEDSIRKELDGS